MMRVPSREALGRWCVANSGRLGMEGGGRVALRGLEVEVLRHVPGKRWTARLSGTLGRGRQTRGFVAIVKSYGSRRNAQDAYRTLEVLDRLREAGAGEKAARFYTPRPLAIDPEQRLVLVEALAGESLEAALPLVGGSPVLGELGQALARFHAGPAACRKRIDVRSLQGHLRRSACAIRAAFPGLAPHLDTLTRRLWLERPRPGRPTLLHGSFRLNHVLVHQGRLALIDLDGASVGPAEFDVANFLASLYYFEAEGRLHGIERREIARRFLNGYRAVARWALDPEALRWYRAALLVAKQARKYATRPRREPERKLRRMLSLAERSLEPASRRAERVRREGLGEVRA